MDDKSNDRLIALEKRQDDFNQEISRIRNSIKGDSDFGVVGLLEQVAANIKSDREWKEATQHLLSNFDSRLKLIESNRPINIPIYSALLYGVIVLLIGIIIVLLVSYFQTSGKEMLVWNLFYSLTSLLP